MVFNVDLFGVETTEADAEVISIAYAILKNFGADDDAFTIKINNRKLINALYDSFNLNDDERYKTSKLIDKKDKISTESFSQALADCITPEKAREFEHVLSSNERLLAYLGADNASAQEIVELIEQLATQGITNVEFSPTLMRGFDYYTGIVFEVFDTSPQNNRSLFGGGRYDDLLDIFGARKIPAVGFGMGDVGARDFLEVHNLLPTYTSPAQLHICTLTTLQKPAAYEVASTLRKAQINISIDISNKKIGDQIRYATKQHIPYIIVIGEDEVSSKQYTLKELATGTESKLDIAGIIEKLTR